MFKFTSGKPPSAAAAGSGVQQFSPHNHASSKGGSSYPPGWYSVHSEDATSADTESKEEKAAPESKTGESLYEVENHSMLATKRVSGVLRPMKAGLPPSLSLVPSVVHTFRVQSNSACTLQPLTLGGLNGLCGTIGTVTNSTCSGIASSMRIRKIIIYPSTSQSGISNAMIEWATAFSGFVKDHIRDTALPLGITNTVPVLAVPPKGSLASNWLSIALGAGAAIMYITCPAGCVIDITLEYTTRGAITGYTFTGVSVVTVGNMYYLPPDGILSNKLRVLGLPTTA